MLSQQELLKLTFEERTKHLIGEVKSIEIIDGKKITTYTTGHKVTRPVLTKEQGGNLFIALCEATWPGRKFELLDE